MSYDIDKLKKIDIVSWLDRQGYKRQRGSGKYVSFYSPFSKESNASMKINRIKNTFVDYHSDLHGDVIDLVMNLEGCDFNRACEILSGNKHVEIASYHVVKEADGVKIHSVEELTDKELLDYILGVRKLSHEVVNTYCKQLTISFPFSETDTERKYVGIGFQTGKNSFEYRNSWQKIACGNKMIKTIRGTAEKENEVLLFEAWIDAMSYLTIRGITQPELKMHILNGARLINVLKPMLDGKTVYAYVDSDRAGDEVIAALTESKVVDMRSEFAFYSDYNEYLQNI